MYMVYAQTEEDDLFTYCRRAERALRAARGFQDQGATLVEISDASGEALEVEEFEHRYCFLGA